MHVLGAMARICVHGSPTERLRDVDLLHAHVEVASQTGFSSPSRA